MARRADWLFGLSVLASIGLETYALATVVVASFGAGRALLHAPPIAVAVVRGLNLTALNAIGVTLVILLLHVVSAALRERDRASTEVWLEGLAHDALTPSARMAAPPRAAHEALLRLRDTVSGDASDRLRDGLRTSGLLRGTLRGRRLRTRFALLDAFETLARARLPETLPRLLPYLAHRDPTVRFAAARAAVRISDGDTAVRLAQRLATMTFPPRAWLELLLLVRTPDALVAALLRTGDAAARWAAIEAVGRRHLLRHVDDVLERLADPNPEMLAAALRALATLRYPPAGHEARVLAAAEHEADFVRLQAVRVLALLPGPATAPTLWARLGDPSFYVRQAAARALDTVDAALLARAAREHPDRYARAMAGQERSASHAA